MKARHSLVPLLAAVALVMLLAGPAWAHAGEANIPAKESLATAMALLQVQPDMTEMIGDKIGDGLDSTDTAEVDLAIAGEAKKAFEAGNNAEALALLAQATGLTPAAAIAMQTNDAARPNPVPLADQLATPGSAGRPSTTAIVVLAIGAVVVIALGLDLARRTR